MVINLGDLKETLFFGKESFYGVTTCEDDCNRLFQNLKRNLVSSTRKTNFIDAEVRKLLNECIIELSYSPRRAQVLVARDERHKLRMIVDYSQTTDTLCWTRIHCSIFMNK